MPRQEHTFEYAKERDTKGTVIYVPVPDPDESENQVAAKTIYFQKQFFDKDKKKWPDKMTITVAFEM